MRSRAEVLRMLLLALALAAANPAGHAFAPDEVRKAAAEVQRDPDLGSTHTEKKLRLRPGQEQAHSPNDSKMPGWVRWLRDLTRWFAESGRLLVWLTGASLLGLLLVGMRRWVRVRGDGLLSDHAPAPSHVQGLDIRAASLPDAVGAAAAQLWEQGEHRAALSLLYRGALSHLVHRDQVPVRGSSTEAECVVLARSRIDPSRGEFFARLVDVWQLAVYGLRLPEGHAVIEVCRSFDQLWPPQRKEAAA